MTAPTHAYVGYDTHGTPMLLDVEDGSRDTARAVKLYQRPAP